MKDLSVLLHPSEELSQSYRRSLDDLDTDTATIKQPQEVNCTIHEKMK